jgi:hypothetical protein
MDELNLNKSPPGTRHTTNMYRQTTTLVHVVCMVHGACMSDTWWAFFWNMAVDTMVVSLVHGLVCLVQGGGGLSDIWHLMFCPGGGTFTPPGTRQSTTLTKHTSTLYQPSSHPVLYIQSPCTTPHHPVPDTAIMYQTATTLYMYPTYSHHVPVKPFGHTATSDHVPDKPPPCTRHAATMYRRMPPCTRHLDNHHAVPNIQPPCTSQPTTCARHTAVIYQSNQHTVPDIHPPCTVRDKPLQIQPPCTVPDKPPPCTVLDIQRPCTR